MRIRLLPLLCLGLACGPAHPGQPTDTAPRVDRPTTVAVAPFAAAKAKHQAEAVILGTKPNGDSTVIPLVGHESSVSVDALWVRLAGGGLPTGGGSSQVFLTTAPQTDGHVRVGMYEQFAGGMGPQWRAAVWISSFVAASVLGKDLTDFRFTAENTGYIDGASAGALMTAGFIASMTGAHIDKHATMTGIVNPDGTVGPVGGIPHKFAASLSAGKTRLGYPVGQQFDTDLDTGAKVDVAALVESKGGKAIEINDVYDAYTFLTGDHLPVPIPVEVNDMAIEPEIDRRIAEHYKAWREMLTTEWARLTELREQGKLPAALLDLAARADHEASAAEELLGQGLTPTAYRRIIIAVVYAAAADITYDVLAEVRQGNLSGARDQLVRFQTMVGETEAALRAVAAIKPGTIGEYLQMLSGFQHAVQSWSFLAFASEQLPVAHRALAKLDGVSRDRLAWDTSIHDQLVRDIIPPALAITRAVAATREATDSLAIEKIDTLHHSCMLVNVRRLAASYASAAAANLAYYESLFIKDTAAQFAVPDEQAKLLLMQRNPDYLIAFMAFQLHRMPAGMPAQLRDDWGEKSLPWGLATLAGGILSYYKTSLLIAKEYSLRVTVNPFTGEPTSVVHQKAFINMMQNAERKAREHARTAKVATGSIPIQARIAYQNARTLRDSKALGDRMRALEQYWASSVYSQAATALARN